MASHSGQVRRCVRVSIVADATRSIAAGHAGGAPIRRQVPRIRRARRAPGGGRPASDAHSRIPGPLAHPLQHDWRALPPRQCGRPAAREEIEMGSLMKTLARSRLLRSDLDYHLVRASMVIIFFFFGYQKRFDYEARELIPDVTNEPLIYWMYPVFGMRGASWFLGVSEWVFGALIFLGFWNKILGALGAAGSCATFIMTVTIIPFMLNGWDAAAGGFPAMTGNVPFLMKDVVLFAVSFYLFKQDVIRASLPASAEREGIRVPRREAGVGKAGHEGTQVGRSAAV